MPPVGVGFADGGGGGGGGGGGAGVLGAAAPALALTQEYQRSHVSGRRTGARDLRSHTETLPGLAFAFN